MLNLSYKVKSEEIFFAFVFVFLHFGAMINFLDAELPFLLITIYLLLILLSLFVLHVVKFDFRSPVSILLAISSLYLTLRTSFATSNFGIYYIFLLIAYNFFLFGLLLSLVLHRKNHKLENAKELVYKNVTLVKLLNMIFMLLYVSLVQYILYRVGATGNLVELIFLSLKTRLTITSEGLSPLLQLSYIINTFGVGLSFILWKAFAHKKFLLIWFAILLYYALVLGSRGAIVLPVLQIALAFSVYRKDVFRVLFKIFLPIIIITVVFSTWFISAREGRESIDSSYSLLSRFDAYENWLRVTSDNGLVVEPAISLLDAPLQFVPRSFYADKPYYYSTEMTRRYVPSAFNRGVNLDFGGISESIFNFYLLGPFIFGLFLGFICNLVRKIYDIALHTKSYIHAIIYSQSIFIPSSFFFIGWINSAMLLVCSSFFVNYLVLIFFEKLITKESKVESIHCRG
ncbi:oligosaccharide repeat unit polymerase [Vibrio vulnificus]|nr:oligosaccharide repeat unit polymerase [Vibrio vulnificus]